MFGQCGCDQGFLAERDEAEIGLAGQLDRGAGNHDIGAEITAHGVKCNGAVRRHWRGQPFNELEQAVSAARFHCAIPRPRRRLGT